MKQVIKVFFIFLCVHLFAVQPEWETSLQLNEYEFKKLWQILELNSGEFFFIYTVGSENGPQIKIQKTDAHGVVLTSNPVSVGVSDKPHITVEATQLLNGNIVFLWKEVGVTDIETKYAIYTQALDMISNPTTIYEFDRDMLSFVEGANDVYDASVLPVENHFYIGLCSEMGAYYGYFDNAGTMLWNAQDNSIVRAAIDLYEDNNDGAYAVFYWGDYQHILVDGTVEPYIDALNVDKIFDGDKILTYDSIYDMNHNLIFGNGKRCLVDKENTIYEIVGNLYSEEDSILVYNSDFEKMSEHNNPFGSILWRVNPSRCMLYGGNSDDSLYFENGQFYTYESVPDKGLYPTASAMFSIIDQVTFQKYNFDDSTYEDVILDESYFHEKIEIPIVSTDSNIDRFAVLTSDAEENKIYRVYDYDKNVLQEDIFSGYVSGYRYYEHNGNPVTILFNDGLKVFYDGELTFSSNAYEYYNRGQFYDENQYYFVRKNNEMKVIAVNHTGVVWETQVLNGTDIRFDLPFIMNNYKVIKLDMDTGEFVSQNPFHGVFASSYNTDNKLLLKVYNGVVTLKVISEDGDFLSQGVVDMGLFYLLNDEKIIVFRQEDNQFVCDNYDYDFNLLSTNYICEENSSSRYEICGNKILILSSIYGEEEVELVTVSDGDYESTHRFPLYNAFGDMNQYRIIVASDTHFFLVWSEISQNYNSYIIDGFFRMSEGHAVLYNTETSIANDDLPSVTALDSRSYPNPFLLKNQRNANTVIEFSLAKEQDVLVSIYNMKGQKVKTIVNRQFSKGKHKILWNGKNESQEFVSSGIYFYKIRAGECTKIRKMTVIK